MEDIRPGNRPPEALPGALRAARYVLLVVLLLLFSEALLPRLFSSETDTEGSVFLRYLWLPTYFCIFMLGVSRWRQMSQIIARVPFLAGLMILSLVSVLWSIDPGLTQRRAVAVIFTTLFGLYLATRFDWRDLLILFAVVWIILGLGSFITGAVIPSFGVMQEEHSGAWRGLWWSKNDMGGQMSRAAFLMLFLTIADRSRRRVWFGAMVLCVMLVLLSTSKTALLGMLLAGGIVAVLVWMRRGPVTIIALTWLGVTAISIGGLTLVFAPDFLFGLIGRDASLTGRTEIWNALGYAIADRPWLGYGYGAFWATESAPAILVRETVEWHAPTAHNGWLETSLSLGFAGVIVFGLSSILFVWRALRLTMNSLSGVFVLGFLAQFALFSISESIIMQQNSIMWVMFSALAGKLACETVERRAATRTSSFDRNRNRLSLSTAMLPRLEQGSAVEAEINPPENLAKAARRPIQIDRAVWAPGNE